MCDCLCPWTFDLFLDEWMSAAVCLSALALWVFLLLALMCPKCVSFDSVSVASEMRP